MDPIIYQTAKGPHGPAGGKRRVLFVDDDPAILKALRVMLKDQDLEWDMEFVVNGAEALKRVKTWCPHVVVSDQKMPGMDGSALLGQVRQELPSALRIMLSGEVGPSGPANNPDESDLFLEKPLKKDSLKAMIAHSNDMEALVPDAVLRREIAALSRLPLLKAAERRLIGEMDLPGASMKRAAALVESDPDLAAMALRMVRSASLSVVQRVDSAGQAALMLGFDNLRGLVFAAGTFRCFDPQLRGRGEHLALVGAGVACAARREAVKLGASAAEESETFSAGLLHGIGVLVLCTLRPALVAQWEQLHPARWAADRDEQDHFGATHAGAGAYLLSLWGLPRAIVNAVAWCQNPEMGELSLVLDALATVMAPRAIEPE